MSNRGLIQKWLQDQRALAAELEKNPETKVDSVELINSLYSVEHNVDYLSREFDAPGSQAFFCSVDGCGRPEAATFDLPTKMRLIEGQKCFYCDFFDKIAEELEVDPKCRVICDGLINCPGPVSSDRDQFKGYGGRTFMWTWNDDPEKVVHESSNMWSNGRVPYHLKEFFPNNAVYLPWHEVKKIQLERRDATSA